MNEYKDQMNVNNTNQGVSNSQKFRGKRGFPNLANCRTSQFVSQILIRITKCTNSKIKFKSEKIKEKKQKKQNQCSFKRK